MVNFLIESPEILRSFLLYIQSVRNKSKKTVEEYFLDLRTFFRYMKIKKEIVNFGTDFSDINIKDINLNFIENISNVDILEYMNYLIRMRNNDSHTRSRKLSSLRSFFKYLTVKVKLIKYDPVKEIDPPKLTKSLPRYMTLDESLKFLETIEKYGGSHKERDYCIATLFLNCGMRLSELVGINLSDIGSDNSLVIMGKGAKERILYLNDSCVRSLEKYKKVRGESRDKDALFISRSKTRISNKTIQYLMKKYFTLAGLSHKKLSTHKLRHTAATLMYQHGGVDIRALKDVLGHESISLTQIYTHTSPLSVKKAIDANPLSHLKEND